ncbi:hypothetical protein SAMN05421636_102270 [Pricia antarctica]|uniref:Lycopene cyclase domain-containing protein n=1 Tax=Pricia antarctica TaxID=641691 RepID=A0A1G6YI00_9FLAO|nr:hypothetical protein [Pricia antarctica]SDD90124.1 hypothetical protein SAMN05421636_102270 [Pricia antarctica]
MDGLTIEIFIVPSMVLAIVTGLYFLFKKGKKNPVAYDFYVANIAIAAFVVNLIWEVAQGPLYEGFEYDVKHISFCALASVADMLMVLLLFFSLGLLYNNIFWIRNLNLKRTLVLVGIGTLGAILAEMWHTSRGDWIYAEIMPLLPLVDVGITPVLQFALLPWLVFYFAKDRIVNKS